jgi:Fe-S-cluster-containing dehydrogenase component/formate-dependent nitrite reductase membrane component NrfD
VAVLWGKLIDHDRCIGCHACSVACKAENGVPLGNFRTWVKQVEKGAGQGVKRHFGVLRCNQCENPPCVEICPTAAMFRRDDGIVDFDSSICIGCKGCIQACPYDAIAIDPRTNTADKCNFCAHRIEVGLEPACVSACPTSALAVSDLNDPTSRVSLTIAGGKVQVRKPELGTAPKVFYKGADETILNPRLAARPIQGYWGTSRETDRDANALPPATGSQAAARVAYDVPREGSPWGEKITAYMFFKAIAAGALMTGGAALLVKSPATLGLYPALMALLGVVIATLLLVTDLKRPDRFLLMLFRPQMKSWLVRGTFALTGGGLVALTWLLTLVSVPFGLTLPFEVGAESLFWKGLGVVAVAVGVVLAGYTALLFGQCKGRQFWQSPLLLPHLVVQAAVAGAASLALLPGLLPVAGLDARVWEGRLLTLGLLLALGLGLNLLMIVGELWMHGNEDARVAVHWLKSGEQATTLYLGVFGMGHVFPAVALTLAFVLDGAAMAVGLAAAAALLGVYLWDHLYVRAGQIPPLS